jgi:hypothetical protein
MTPTINKYRNVRTVVDGKNFASRREANRYTELKLLERGNLISNLETQVRFALNVNGLLISHYVADFKYFDKGKKAWVIEDAKGFATDVYKLKKKLVRALYGIEIVEV